MRRKQRRLFERLYNQHARGIFSQAWRLCCFNREDAEDVTQETFLRALKGFERYVDQDTEFAWLRTICLNIVREKWRRKTFFQQNIQQTKEDICFVKPSPDPLLAAQSAQALNRVIQAMDTIKPEYREVIILKHLTGMDDTEIAEIQQINVATVRSRLRRGRQALAVVLSREAI